MLRSAARAAAVIAAICIVDGAAVARAADVSPAQDAVTLSINPDGTATWNGERLANEPALEAKVAQHATQSPKLQLDLRFHTVSGLNDSNRQTLLDLIELTARYGYVHVETFNNGARLTVLAPSAAGASGTK